MSKVTINDAPSLRGPRRRVVTDAGNDLSRITRRLESRLLQHLPTAVVVIDDAGMIVHWNDRAEATYGYRAADVIGRSVADLRLTPEGSDTVALLESATAESGRWEGDFDARRADGSVVPVHAVAERILDDEVGFVGYVSASNDMSERRALEGAHAHELLHDPLTGLPNRSLFGDQQARSCCMFGQRFTRRLPTRSGAQRGGF